MFQHFFALSNRFKHFLIFLLLHRGFMSFTFCNGFPDHFLFTHSLLIMCLLTLLLFLFRCCDSHGKHFLLRLLIDTTRWPDSCGWILLRLHWLSNRRLNQILFRDWATLSGAPLTTLASLGPLLIIIRARRLIVASSGIAKDALTTVLSDTSLIHEIVEDVIVFDGEDVHHVFKLEMRLVLSQQVG